MSKLNSHIVILAGGRGTRFWPLSRSQHPKQFLAMNGSELTMIQETVFRLKDVIDENKLWVVTHKDYEFLVQQQIPNAKLILEPTSKNTAASIALAMYHIQQEDPDGTMIVLPADHIVGNTKELVGIFRDAEALANKEELLITIGIKTLSPNTGYGYIKRGAELMLGGYNVARFFEKPNLDRATKYHESEDFFWNSGMFIWSIRAIMDAYQEHLPEIYNGLDRVFNHFDKEDVFNSTLEQEFQNFESISVDMGIMEHARNCAVFCAADLDWNDVGAWDSWAKHIPKDKENNTKIGEIIALDTSNCIVHSKNKLTAVLGLKDLAIINTDDALLICPIDKVQDVKKIVKELENIGRIDLV